MGFLQKLCPCFNSSSSSRPSQIHRMPKDRPQSQEKSATQPRRRRHARRKTGYQPLTLTPQNAPAHLTMASPLAPHARTARRVRHQTSEAHIQYYPLGSFGPPVLTTGPPLQERWITGTKKKFVYSNADVIWRSNERRVKWGERQERIFHDDTSENVPVRGSKQFRQRKRIRRYPSRDSLRKVRQQTPPTPLQCPIPLPNISSLPNAHISSMSSQVQLHSDLRCQGLYDPPSPCIHWDIRCPPHFTAARISPQYSQNVSPLDLSASATNPPSRQITITVDNPELEFWMGHWGPIHVSAATGLAYAFLSIEDILGDIYEYFQTPLTPNDLACIPPGRWRGMLEEAKRMRLKASRVIHEGGYVRADLLNGNTRFAGLRWARNHRLVLVTSC